MSPSTRRALARGLAAFFVLAAVTTPALAHAGEVQLAGGPGAYASSWRGDGTFGQALKVGYRFADLVAIDSIGRLGYGTVDERVITYLSVGGTLYGRLGPVRPYVRLAFVHQHEEPSPGVRADPYGTVFGVGDGIRHRAGFGSSLGVDYPIQKTKSGVEVTVGIDTSGVWFPDPRGPKLYAGGALWLGLNLGL
ncbi:MAG TPA: hypothetical protein VLT33_37230 [Labilithrix sp.]|nr:hypothetical protein [Labilithrix sp.]